MIKMIAFSIVCSLSLIAKVHVVELADFSCKYCKEAEAYTPFLKDKIKKNGDEFHFAPLGLNTEEKSLELIYYKIKDDEELERFLRPIMFDLTQESKIKINSAYELIEWLEIYTTNKGALIKRLKESIEDDEYQNVGSLLRSMNLATEIQIKQTPTFVIISSKTGLTPVLRTSKMTINDYVEHTIATYERIKDNEK